MNYPPTVRDECVLRYNLVNFIIIGQRIFVCQKKKTMSKYYLISPDGIEISGLGERYKNKKEALVAAKKYVKRFEVQGYYASNEGRIELKDLPSRMFVSTSPFGEELIPLVERKRPTLYLTPTTKDEISDNWGVKFIFYPNYKGILYITCDKNRRVRWEYANVYRPKELKNIKRHYKIIHREE